MTDYTQEHATEDPWGEGGALSAELNADFDFFAQADLAETAQGYEGLIEAKILTREEVQSMLATRQKQLTDMNLSGRMRELVNNFRFWLPDGQYRELAVKQKTEGGGNETELAVKERLVQDLDALIQARGYTQTLEHIGSTSGGYSEDVQKVLAEMYLAMRQKGYEGVILRR